MPLLRPIAEDLFELACISPFILAVALISLGMGA
jgi:hypothetical protein